MKPQGSEKWIVCRVCLQQPPDGMQPIFDESDEKDLTQMILDCGGVPIQKFDHYPDKICAKCLKYLKVAHKFRVTCQRSHKHLSRFIAPVAVDIEEQLMAFVEEDEIEELNLKVEPNEVKQEVEDSNDILDVFNVLDEESKEFVVLENINNVTGTEEAEYLDEVEQELIDSDEECVSHQKFTPCKPIFVQSNAPEKVVLRKYTYIKKETKPKKPPIKPRRPKETSFICDVCGNIYPSQGRLNEHIKVHLGIKPYDCEICGHRFAQTQQLSRHMNTHTGQRPFKCEYCPAAFADLSTRNKHHRIHTNERPYICDTCGKTFTYTNTLKIHKMIHTGEKPHVCEVCGKGFPQAYKLRNHMLTHAKKPNEDTKMFMDSFDTDDDGNHVAIQLLEM